MQYALNLLCLCYVCDSSSPAVDKEAWLADVENIKDFYKLVGDRVPAEMYDELEALEARLSK